MKSTAKSLLALAILIASVCGQACGNAPALSHRDENEDWIPPEEITQHLVKIKEIIGKDPESMLAMPIGIKILGSRIYVLDAIRKNVFIYTVDGAFVKPLFEEGIVNPNASVYDFDVSNIGDVILATEDRVIIAGDEVKSFRNIYSITECVIDDRYIYCVGLPSSLGKEHYQLNVFDRDLVFIRGLGEVYSDSGSQLLWRMDTAMDVEANNVFMCNRRFAELTIFDTRRNDSTSILLSSPIMDNRRMESRQEHERRKRENKGGGKITHAISEIDILEGQLFTGTNKPDGMYIIETSNTGGPLRYYYIRATSEINLTGDFAATKEKGGIKIYATAIIDKDKSGIFVYGQRQKR